jgi:uncharacterized membrane protein YcaP (DUF421 family)
VPFWDRLYDFADRALGLELSARDLHFSHMAARSFVVFCFAIVLARAADRRFMGRSACFDFMLAVILGSVLSRGINGQAPFFATLGASALLVLLHHVVGTIAFRSHWFSDLVKGRDVVLVRDGQVDEGALRRNRITYDDLCENLRTNGNVHSLEDVEEARLERNGSVSVVKRKPARASGP